MCLSLSPTSLLTSTPLTMQFLNLPTEIIVQILLFLDYPSLRVLTQQNHFLHSLLTDKMIREAMIDHELNDRDFFDRHNALPCYGCRRIPSKQEFCKIEPTSIYALAGSRRDERRCQKCDADDAGAHLFEANVEIESLSLAVSDVWGVISDPAGLVTQWQNSLAQTAGHTVAQTTASAPN